MNREIATAVRTPERDEFLGFTGIYIPTPLVIMTRSDEEGIGRAEDLAGRRVALVKGYSSSKRVLSEYPQVEQVPVDTPLDGLKAVALGDADAYVGVLGINVFLSSKHGITNLKVAAGYELEENGQRFLVVTPVDEPTAPIIVALDWSRELERRAPTGD